MRIPPNDGRAERSLRRWFRRGTPSRVGAVLLLFVTSALLTPGSNPASASLGEVPDGQFYSEAVSWAVTTGLLTGTSPGCFEPERSVARGEVAVVLWRFSDQPSAPAPHPFTDVTDAAQDEPIAWMAANGITTGATGTTFAPDEAVQRGELATFLWRLAGRPIPTASHQFQDIVHPWQQDPVSWLIEAGITTGTSATTFGPSDPISRAELATLLWRHAGSPDSAPVASNGCSNRIDTSRCPIEWTDTTGLHGADIRLGTSYPTSGPLGSFAKIERGMAAWFDHANRTDTFAGRQIRLETRDDGYDPARTLVNVTDLVDAGVFAVAAPVGTPHGLAIQAPLNDACVPLLFQLSGHPAFGDPVSSPWSTGGLLSFRTEALLWGQHILDESNAGRIPTHPEIALFVADNELGDAYLAGFEDFAMRNTGALSIASVSRHSANDPDITDDIDRLYDLRPASGEVVSPDVVILMTSSLQCTDAIRAIDRGIWEPDLKLISNTCASIASFLAPAGQAALGWRHISASLGSDPMAAIDATFAAELQTAIATAGLDATEPRDLPAYLTGVAVAIPIVEALSRANQDPAGLSRTALMRAIRSQSFDHPLLAGGGRFQLNGTTDAYAIESGEVREYRRTDDVGAHVPIALVDAEGQTGIYSESGR